MTTPSLDLAALWRRDDPLVLRPDEGWTLRPGTQLRGDRFVLSGEETGGRLAIVTHVVQAGWFAPPHTHTREDEYSYILEGRFGFEIGDRTFEAEAGSLVFKPREVRHAFWKIDEGEGVILEIISPAGIERFFAESLALFQGGRLPRPEETVEPSRRYGAVVDVAGTPAFLARHGLKPPAR